MQRIICNKQLKIELEGDNLDFIFFDKSKMLYNWLAFVNCMNELVSQYLFSLIFILSRTLVSL